MLQLTPAYAAIGTIDSLAGDVHVIAGGREVPARSGLRLNEGDTVRTGAHAWALFVMSDGASLALRPNSRLRFDIYRYSPAGDATRSCCLLSLLEGAFRSVTGFIGPTSRSNYHIRTPNAQIGIRGTDHELAYYPPAVSGRKSICDPGTYDRVNAGESFIINAQGNVRIAPGQVGFAPDGGRTRPRLLSYVPAFYEIHTHLDRKSAAHREKLLRRLATEVRRSVDRKSAKRGHVAARHPSAAGFSQVTRTAARLAAADPGIASDST